MFYDIFERLCIEKGVKPSRVADEIGISRATVTNWKKNGYSPRANVLEKLSAYFGVSPSVFMEGTAMPEQQPKEKPALTRRDERDIAKQLEKMLAAMDSNSGLMFDGEPLDDETRELLRESLRNQLVMTKLIAKQKFTPKKYRK